MKKLRKSVSELAHENNLSPRRIRQIIQATETKPIRPSIFETVIEQASEEVAQSIKKEEGWSVQDTRNFAGQLAAIAVIKFCKSFGGYKIKIPLRPSFLRNNRNADILSKFKGNNYRELAQEYFLSIRQVRRIVLNKKVTKRGC